MTSKIKEVPTPKSTNKSFDFDYWSKLAKNDPDAFEVARKLEIDQHISSLKGEALQDRMRRLQWRVNIERKRSKNPMDSAIRIYDMMWESVGKNFQAIQDLSEQFKPEAERKIKKTSRAKVLPFNQEVTGTEG